MISDDLWILEVIPSHHVPQSDAPPPPSDLSIIPPRGGAVAPGKPGVVHQRLPADGDGGRRTDGSLQWTQADPGPSAGSATILTSQMDGWTFGSTNLGLTKPVRATGSSYFLSCVCPCRYLPACPTTPPVCF